MPSWSRRRSRAAWAKSTASANSPFPALSFAIARRRSTSVSIARRATAAAVSSGVDAGILLFSRLRILALDDVARDGHHDEDERNADDQEEEHLGEPAEVRQGDLPGLRLLAAGGPAAITALRVLVVADLARGQRTRDPDDLGHRCLARVGEGGAALVAALHPGAPLLLLDQQRVLLVVAEPERLVGEDRADVAINRVLLPRRHRAREEQRCQQARDHDSPSLRRRSSASWTARKASWMSQPSRRVRPSM